MYSIVPYTTPPPELPELGSAVLFCRSAKPACTPCTPCTPPDNGRIVEVLLGAAADLGTDEMQCAVHARGLDVNNKHRRRGDDPIT